MDRIVAAFAEVSDAEERKRIKDEFVRRFGMPQSLTADQVADAEAWLADQIGGE